MDKKFNVKFALIVVDGNILKTIKMKTQKEKRKEKKLGISGYTRNLPFL